RFGLCAFGAADRTASLLNNGSSPEPYKKTEAPMALPQVLLFLALGSEKDAMRFGLASQSLAVFNSIS
ncbi:MAG: hypothetical protein PHV32_08800, partial [Eubacteriales bacterium]|nr:hypothetical protein [Eubacteriales bacterium]